MKLTKREQEVIHLRYVENKSLKEIAEIYGVTKERIRQVEAKALWKTHKNNRNTHAMIAIIIGELSRPVTIIRTGASRVMIGNRKRNRRTLRTQKNMMLIRRYGIDGQS